MTDNIDKVVKGSQIHKDYIGNYLSRIRNKVVSKYIRSPFLDIACGENLLANYINGGFGADIIDYGNADIIVRDFSKIPFSDNSFQTISIIASINYFSNPKEVILEVKRLLKYSGILLITMSNSKIMNIWHKFRDPWANSYSLQENQITELIESSGLEYLGKKSFMLGANKIYFARKLK